MSDLLNTANRFRRNLLNYDAAALGQLTDAYSLIYQRISERLNVLLREMQAARARGEEVNQAWLQRNGRLQILQAQVEAELQTFARYAEAQISRSQSELVNLASEQAEQLILTGLDGRAGAGVIFTRLPTGALENLVGNLSDGSPLSTLLNELGPNAAAATRDVLVTGVALGENPRVMARRMREALGGSLTRALLISRQESIRAFRESSYQTMNANRDVLRGWIWTASLSTRTCGVCWAKHGTFHAVEERLESHIACRCVAVPITKDSSVKIKSGTEQFADLPAEKQQLILGGAKYEAYSDGRLQLENLVGVKRSRQWGTTLYERPLREILGSRKAA